MPMFYQKMKKIPKKKPRKVLPKNPESVGLDELEDLDIRREGDNNPMADEEKVEPTEGATPETPAPEPAPAA